MMLFNEYGEVLWKRDLGRGVVPGVWFCPVLAFDVDGDGVDEIWYVNNKNPQHPLGLSSYCLERLDSLTGMTTGQWKWPNYGGAQDLSHVFRNFILGGYVEGQPVLVTAQGTYGSMFLQGYKAGMESIWETVIREDEPGARGSHMTPVVDLNSDGIDELMWGERCIELKNGKELFCCDRDTYNGHSDIIQPVLDKDSGKWFIFTCREGDDKAAPRIVLYDSEGQRVWGDVELGHIDMGWVARLGEKGEFVSMGIRIGHKICGPDGRYHQGMDEFSYQALSGIPYRLPFSLYKTIPVDLNGDGIHELVQGAPGGNGKVMDRAGNVIGNIGGAVALAAKLLDHPGEQLLSYSSDGYIRIWGDANASDSEEAQERYQHPYYKAAMRVAANGYNLCNLGGL